MKTLKFKDTETGNWMIISHSDNTVIVDTENDKAEIMGTFKGFGKLLNDNAKMIESELQISEESAFGTVLKLISEKYSELKIIYTVKYEDNTVLDVLQDFSRDISESTEFEIHCAGGYDWVAKVNDLLIYENGEQIIAMKEISKKNMFIEETQLQLTSNRTTLSEVTQLIDEFNDIQNMLKIEHL
jgi:hypothetical protein